MFTPAAFALHHREGAVIYSDLSLGRLDRSTLSRGEYLDGTLIGVVDLPSKIIRFAYEFFRSLTIGFVFLREHPRNRLIDSWNGNHGLFTGIGQIFWGVIGFLCPHEAGNIQRRVDK